MINLFDGVPEGTTHRNGPVLYKFTDDAVFIWVNNRWVYSAPPSAYADGSMEQIIAITKPWSGPVDGLPPVNSRLYMHLDESDEWILGTVIAHVTLEDGDFAVAHNSKDVFHGFASDFRAIWTPESRESELRETAIREIMDVADVDCRVTAARLVDAGFKREVV